MDVLKISIEGDAGAVESVGNAAARDGISLGRAFGEHVECL